MERLKIDLNSFSEKNALIHYYLRDKAAKIIKYKELLEETNKVGTVIKALVLSKNQSNAIGITCSKNPSAVAIVLGVIQSEFAFCFINKEDIPERLHKLGIKCFLSDKIVKTDDVLKLQNSFEVFGRKIHVYETSCMKEIREFKDLNDSSNRICYTITTSGTTAHRKIVRVTYNSIASNVFALQNIFQLNNDVIFSSAPCTFDVFALDLFLALHSGSALMLMEEQMRYTNESLNLMFAISSTSVTFLQITPSLFQQLYGIDHIREILHSRSSLRYLVLGGEQFPSTKEVLEWQDWDCPTKKRVFNIYGTTEMSCWAMIHEVTKDDLQAGEVPLGALLDDTKFAFLPDLSDNSGLEEIFLISKRRVCFIDDDDLKKAFGEEVYFAYMTGDLVKRQENAIFYRGRKNDVIKRFGERVNLNVIELVASEIVPAVACIYMRKNIVLFVSTENEEDITKISNLLKSKLKSSEQPDEIRKISFLPLSENGKVSKQQLKEIYKEVMKEDREKRIEAEESFLEAINQILNLKLGKPSPKSDATDEPDGKRIRTEMDLTFRSLGGTSFDALRISMKLEEQTGLSNGLLPKLLGDHHSIREICLYLKEIKPHHHETVPFRVNSSSIVTEVVQRFNLEKCVDASPALLHVGDEHLISVGSHAHQLITIDANSLKILSKCKLGDRIESEVRLSKQSGIVGCYDGLLYSFNFKTGTVDWSFDSKGMIKSKALVVGDLTIFGNYNYETNLWCLDSSGSLIWNRLVGSRGILAAPLLVEDSSVLICTLDGTVELINAADGTRIWTKKFETPVFSSPQKIPGRNAILIAEVSKIVHCIDYKGATIWNFQTDGHIFSSFTFDQSNENEVKILFGCHDKKLRCLNYNYGNQIVNLHWSVELPSHIFGTPKLAKINSENFVISAATGGQINFIKLSDGKVEHSHKLPGEIFSTPVIFERKLFVGCRDDFLYCIQF